MLHKSSQFEVGGQWSVLMGAKGLFNLSDLRNKGIISSLKGKVGRLLIMCKALKAGILLIIFDSDN